MSYISAVDFKACDTKTKDLLLKWWQPAQGDLIAEIKSDKTVLCINSIDIDVISVYTESIFNSWKLKSDVIPLLTEMQLIEFIKWRTGGSGIKKIEFGTSGGYFISLNYKKSKGLILARTEAPNWYTEKLSFFNKDLLTALWKCANEVASDTYYDK